MWAKIIYKILILQGCTTFCEVDIDSLGRQFHVLLNVGAKFRI